MAVGSSAKSRRTARGLKHGPIVMSLRGRLPGPKLGLLGGVHGDEDEGVLAVRLILKDLSFRTLSGTVQAVAPANTLAWSEYSRNGSEDSVDLARCFPGCRSGSWTQALAAELTAQVISGADLLIDLHSAGLQYRMPLFCGFVQTGPTAELSRRAAVAFGAPMIWAHDHVGPGRSLTAAADRGVPAIYAECSGGGSIRASELDAYVSGVLAVMAEFGMLVPEDRRVGVVDRTWVYGDGDLDQGATAGADGFFVSATTAGAMVDEGEDIGFLYDYDGELVRKVQTPRSGVVMFLRRRARTRSEDVLFVLAQPKRGAE